MQKRKKLSLISTISIPGDFAHVASRPHFWFASFSRRLFIVHVCFSRRGAERCSRTERGPGKARGKGTQAEKDARKRTEAEEEEQKKHLLIDNFTMFQECYSKA